MTHTIEPLDRIFTITDIDNKTCSTICGEIYKINASDATILREIQFIGGVYIPDPIEILIETDGGCAYPAMGLSSTIMRSTTPVHTTCLGSAFSAGTIILASGEKRQAHEYSTAMVHGLSTGTWGGINEMEIDMVEAKRLEKQLLKFYTTHTNMEKAMLKKHFKKGEDWYLDAEGMLEYGLIDNIITD